MLISFTINNKSLFQGEQVINFVHKLFLNGTYNKEFRVPVSIFVGPCSSGKTTVMNLFIKFFKMINNQNKKNDFIKLVNMYNDNIDSDYELLFYENEIFYSIKFYIEYKDDKLFKTYFTYSIQKKLNNQKKILQDDETNSFVIDDIKQYLAKYKIVELEDIYSVDISKWLINKDNVNNIINWLNNLYLNIVDIKVNENKQIIIETKVNEKIISNTLDKQPSGILKSIYLYNSLFSGDNYTIYALDNFSNYLTSLIAQNIILDFKNANLNKNNYLILASNDLELLELKQDNIQNLLFIKTDNNLFKFVNMNIYKLRKVHSPRKLYIDNKFNLFNLKDKDYNKLMEEMDEHKKKDSIR